MDLEKKCQNLIFELEKKLKGKTSTTQIRQISNKYLNEVNALFKSVKNFAPKKKKHAGQILNSAKKRIEAISKKSVDSVKTKNILPEVDLTACGVKPSLGTLHPVTQILDLVERSFGELGFTVAEGPNIETDYYCFEALNMPDEHPARDMQDSFYLNKEMTILPRTHTSSVQIRYMKEHRPPIKILVPGRCYRNEKIDVRHFIEFYQFEGLVVDDHTTVADLKGTIELAMRKVMEEPGLKVRFRHCYFPYTEPSFELDFSCAECHGKGKVNGKRCKVCSAKGWLEIGGLGMVHPTVLKNVGISPKKYQGFAFGWGPARLAMIKYKIPHFKLFWEGDIRFLKQF